MDESEKIIEELTQRLESLKQEVDALQVAVMSAKAPWYRDIPTIVSVLALIFSLGTTFVSYQKSKAEDIQASRAELRSLLQRLAALPKENLEITKQYADDAVGRSFASGYIAQETSLLARQAAEIANGLPRRQVTSAEYQAISLALWNSGDAVAALPFASRAVESATDAASAANALRAYAGDLFATGQPEQGREQYRKALAIFDRYPGYGNYYQGSTHFITQLSWANAEADSGFVDLTYEHLVAAELIVSQLPPGPGADQLKRQLEQQRAVFDAARQQMLSRGTQ